MDTSTVTKEDPKQLRLFRPCKGSICDNVKRCDIAGTCTYVSSAEQMRHDMAVAVAEKAVGMMLPVGSSARKEAPITTGVLDYFPLALAAVARLSKKGNDKHNPGQPLHWSRAKSQDHADCIPRHLIDRGVVDPDSGELHEVSLAWRALAMLELAEEQRLGKSPSRGSR